MSNSEAFARRVFVHLLNREPLPDELRRWSELADRITPAELLDRVASSPEYAARQRVPSLFPAGHYHSPVVDPATVRSYVEAERRTVPGDLRGISVSIPRMTEFWERHHEAMRKVPFPEEKRPDRRFHFKGAPYPYGDAFTLFAMIGEYRPKRIVEIGSGFSTACMLDSADHYGLEDLQILCIEPDARRLRSLLLPGDERRVTVIEQPVQQVPVEQIVGGLQRSDILFIDSTHVLKTGSDVHYELFHVLPEVRSGVVIHVHDCPYPFEYPDKWVFEENYSWNEAYALRAFLMYNTAFSILFWPSLFRGTFPARVRDEGGRFSVNPGSSVWLERL